MRLISKLTTLLILLGTFLACSEHAKPPIDEPDDPFIKLDTSSKLKIIWQQPMGADTADYKSRAPSIWGDNVAFSKIDFSQNIETVQTFDRQTGAFRWNWSPYIRPTFMGKVSQSNQYLLLNNSFEVYSLNLENGQVLWDTEIPIGSSGNPRAGVVFDHIYHSRGNEIIIDTVCFLVRSPISHENWDTIFSLKAVDGYRPDFEMPGAWISPAGDTIIYFQNRQWNFPKSDGKIDLWALNLRTREPIWTQWDIEITGNSAVLPPQIYDGKVYFCGQGTLFCFDALTGEKLWQKVFTNDNILLTSLLFAEGKLFIKPTNDGKLYAIEPNTGNTVYTTPKCGLTARGLHYFNGNIYYCTQGTGKLYAIKASDGTIIWEENSPNHYRGNTRGMTSFTDDLTIDKERNILYTNDSFYFMAIELPN